MLFGVGTCVAGASWHYGIWSIRIGRRMLMLKAPWNEPLFSERYGFNKTLLACRDWRLLWRSPGHKLEAAE